MQKNKIRVGVLYGGRSGEHDVSVVSASHVIRNLDRSQFEVIPIGIDKQGTWFLGHDSNAELKSPEERTLEKCMLFTPNAIGTSLQHVQSTQCISSKKNNERVFDVLFPVIHGVLGEDGTVQGLLELADIPYVGCGVLASAIGMDKDMSKRLVGQAGIPVPPYHVIKEADFKKNPLLCCEKMNATLRYPLFVKPANTGSSVGIEKVKTPENLAAAIHHAFEYDTKVVVEQGITPVTEIEVAVLESLDDNIDPIVSIPGEVRPSRNHEFYSYASKYLDEKGAELIIPAPISTALQKKIQHIAKTIFNVLDCESMARVDLFLEKETQEIYFNEINTIPGFTHVSMYPKLIAASGMNYADLLSHLIHLAIKRHTRKKALRREV